MQGNSTVAVTRVILVQGDSGFYCRVILLQQQLSRVILLQDGQFSVTRVILLLGDSTAPVTLLRVILQQLYITVE